MQTPIPLRTPSARPQLIVDQWGVTLADPDGNVVGVPGPLGGTRLVYALPTNIAGGNLSRRYRPPHPAGESAIFGMSYEFVIPLGISIAQGKLDIFSNVVPPVDVRDHFKVSGVTIRGRTLYATVSGGIDGNDYQLVWTATDTQGNIWPRVGLVLCAATS